MNEFTNLYQLQKTLRFELKPVGADGNTLDAATAAENFKSIIDNDKKIKNAYIALKPVMDKIHEQVITDSLTSDEAKNIDFSAYFIEYEKGKEKKLDNFEKNLRNNIGSTFNQGVKQIKEKAPTKTKKTKGKTEEMSVLEKKGIECLTEAGILQYIKKNISDFVDDEQERKIIVETHLSVFEKFFTYFTGYNQNRENYYESKEEKSTAVATRIVHDNLPKFCDNILLFKQHKDDYEGAKQYLEDNNRTTQIKDAKTNKMVEASHIEAAMFQIKKFSDCLSQAGIEEYNETIGHYNLLINLYNQACREEKDFKKLPHFKTLFKQIGCGKRKALYEEIENEEQLKKTIQDLIKAGNKYFDFTQQTDTVDIKNLADFIAWLKERGEHKDWNGIYWSKAAVDKVSGIYFANWFQIKEKLKGNKACVSYDKKREEQIKINDAVELSGLFAVLDQEVIPFKDSVYAGEFEYRKEIVDDTTLKPSQKLISLICTDMEKLAKAFTDKKQLEKIQGISDFKNEDNILTVKQWLDNAIFAMRMVKYFSVKEKKIKGNSIDSDLSNFLQILLRAEDIDWFKQYDLIRNYLTKKPQDDAKENKLKLNFENPALLGGWSDGQEKNKSAVILKNGNKQYLGILMKRSLFDTTEKEGTKKNPIYNASDDNIGRLILRTIAFKTLAGKGFVSFYDGEKYGDVGKDSPVEAIQKLQRFMKEYPTKEKPFYLTKYPLLKEIADKNYTDKQVFEKELNEKLSECYECKYTPIDWNKVLEAVNAKDLYLFEIYSKDFSDNKSEKDKKAKANLQTLYWRHIFEEDSTIQLCAEGEIFFREEVRDVKAFVHYKNQPIKRRSDGKIESKFSHDIVKNKRFTENKFLFHIPTKTNYKQPKNFNINEIVSDNFTKSGDIQFLGIDRGEKHLIYYSLIDITGKIIEQGNFDTINGKNYLAEINKAAEKRKERQENWQQKGNIKNLKDGYISLVIHEIIEKMKDKDGNYKPTFIVLEDLNTGFKRSRQKFEQQVYQKFELALAKKLNYLVDKNVTDNEKVGSVSKALQLTPPIANYQDIENRKQVGIMLYTRANYTSVTDPVTGWRKTIYLQKGSEEAIRKQILGYFSEIGVENGNYFFEYKDADTNKTWRLWSGKDGKSLDRYRFRRGNAHNENIIESYDLKDMLDRLFVDFDKNKSLKQQLESGVALTKIDDKNTAWESLRFVIDIIQQIRNSGDTAKGQDDNFLQSPVRNEQGEHFDSSKKTTGLPDNGDANGAYNIARKGLIMYEHIKQWVKNGKPDKNPNLFISDEEWDLWLTNREQWDNKLSDFSSQKQKGGTND